MAGRSSPEEIVFDPDLVLSPTLVLSMWAAGLAGAASAVATWKIVGPGFFWTVSGATLLAGGWTASAGGAGIVGALALVGAALVARWPRITAPFYGVAAVAFASLAAARSGWLLAVTGAVALGGVTGEMLLGHWYLVDPKLPRWSLRALDLVGVGALVADAALLIAAGALDPAGVVSWAFLGLSAMSILLMTAVWFSLREPSYTGVMAATGLSYLAVLTALGAVVAGRSLVGDAANLLASLHR